MNTLNLFKSALKGAFLLLVVCGGSVAWASQRTCLRVSDQSDNVKEFYLHGYDGDYVADKVEEILDKINDKHRKDLRNHGKPIFLWYDVEQYIYGTFGHINGDGRLLHVSHAEAGCDEIDKVDAYIDLKIFNKGQCASIEKRFTGFRPLK